MLSVNTYSAAYIADARAAIDLQQATWHSFLIAAHMGEDKAAIGAAQDAFEPVFFRHLILAMDHYFDHRARATEGKDGNPINEVRVLCNSIMHNHHKLMADTQIRLDPARSVLGLKVGDPIRLSAADFKRLSDAFFAEIAARFGA